MEEEIVIIVRPMRIARAFAAFFCGVLAGWLVIACFMMVHDGVDIGGVLRLVTLWLPVAAVYSVVIVAASHRLLARFAPTLLLLLGCVVGLLPFLGYWPPYFPDFRPLIARRSFGSCRDRWIRVGSRRVASHAFWSEACRSRCGRTRGWHGCRFLSRGDGHAA